MYICTVWEVLLGNKTPNWLQSKRCPLTAQIPKALSRVARLVIHLSSFLCSPLFLIRSLSFAEVFLGCCTVSLDLFSLAVLVFQGYAGLFPSFSLVAITPLPSHTNF